jgi:hypothetical protein
LYAYPYGFRSDGEEQSAAMDNTLRVETRSRKDANCIAAHLTEFGATTDADDTGCVVVVHGVVSHAVISALLVRIQCCLNDEKIARVQVFLNRHTYSLEGARADRVEAGLADREAVAAEGLGSSG